MCSKALAFTGHRPESLPFGENEMDERCNKLKALLLDEITGRAAAGYDAFYCGAARGADIIFGRQVLSVKTTSYPSIVSFTASQFPSLFPSLCVASKATKKTGRRFPPGKS